MNKLYRLLSALLAAALLLTATACSGGTAPAASDATPVAEGSSATASTGQPAASGDTVKLRFAWWGGDARHEATIAVMENYKKANPNVTIEGEYGGFDGYLEKLITQLAADTAPDIMQTDYAFLEPFWGKMDCFVDFYNDTVVDKSGFSQDMLKGISAPSGELIGLPTGLNFSTMFVNKGVADKFGIDVSKPFSWDELMANGKKLHQQDPESYLLYPNSVNRYIFEPYLFNLTGKKLVEADYTLGFDRESVKKAYQYISDLYANGVMQPFDETIEIKSPYESPKWLADQILMLPDFSSGYDPAKTSLGDRELACMPLMGDSAADNTGIVLRPTNMISVYAKSKNVDSALAFVNYFFNDMEAIDTLGTVRSVPSTSKALDRMVELQKLDSGLKAVADFSSEHKGGAGQNIISTNTELETIETDILAELYYGDLTPDTAADKFMQLMTDKVDELKQIAAK